MSNYNMINETASTEANSRGYGNNNELVGKSNFVGYVPSLTDLSQWAERQIIAGTGGLTAGQLCVLTANFTNGVFNGTYTATASTLGTAGAWFVAKTTASVGAPVFVRAVGIDSVNAVAGATITAGQQCILTGSVSAKTANPSTANGANWVSAQALTTGQTGEFFFRAVRENSVIVEAYSNTSSDIIAGQQVALSDGTNIATFGDEVATINATGAYVAGDDIPAGSVGLFTKRNP